MNDLKSERRPPRTPEQVRADIERARQQIESSVVGLRQQLAIGTDWRKWVRERPGLFVAGAFALGFVLGNRRR